MVWFRVVGGLVSLEVFGLGGDKHRPYAVPFAFVTASRGVTLETRYERELLNEVFIFHA